MLNTLITLLTLISINDSMIDKSIQLFETRHLDTTYLTTSANILEDIVKNEPNNLLVNYSLSKVYYTLGDHAEIKNEKLAYYYKGLEYGKKAIQLDSSSAWAHFWYMANLGQIAQLKGIFKSLVSVSEVKKEIDIVLRIDPNNVMALNAKAMVYYDLPGILGGDLNKSIALLKRAIEIDSNYSMAYVTMGKSYIRKKDYKAARLYLNKVLSLENGWPIADFIMDDKPEAIKLLKEIEHK